MANITPWNRHVNRNLIDHPEVAGALSAEAIEDFARQAGHDWRQSIWSPATTVLTFLLQVLDGAKTLRAAVAVLLTHLAARGQPALPSCDPSAYCQARRRLPFEVLTRLLGGVAERMGDLVTAASGWRGRRVWMVDGSSVSMPDTPELQEAFPQPAAQAPGCGFPVAQFVALFCWSTGAIVDLAIDSIRPHELSLFRALWPHFTAGDVVLADRAYSSFVDMARLQQQGVYTIFRLHQRRSSDLRAGRRLGPNDRLVTWQRPKQWRPSCGIGQEEFMELPETLSVRLVRITQAPRGFRSRTLVVATTLIDPVDAPADEIRGLYRDRWTAELNLRSIKTHLGMEVLRGQSVDVIYKEIVMHLLAYNLIRLLMWHAAREHGRDLHRLSFTGTLHRLRPVLPLLLFHPAVRGHPQLVAFLIQCIAEDELPDRPDRMEPRRVKRRPKQYSRLMKPRRHYRQHGDPDAR
jgi:hypothetical protein